MLKKKKGKKSAGNDLVSRLKYRFLQSYQIKYKKYTNFGHNLYRKIKEKLMLTRKDIANESLKFY